MFNHTRHQTHGHDGHHTHRQRRREMHRDAADHLRGELRRNLRRGGAGPDVSFRDLFGHGRGRGPVVRRGEVRGLILAALRDRPMHGYEVIQELEAQSEGRWRPSAGSVYPTLQQLADEDLVTGSEVDGRRTYTLTESGRKAAKEAAEAAPRSRWATSDDDGEPDLRRYVVELASASIQVNRMGSPATKREVAKILGDARRQVYRLLSEDASAEDLSTEASEATADAATE